MRSLVHRHGDREVVKGDARWAAAHAAKMFHASRTERHDFEYDAVKLERVVNAAMERAQEVGKPDLADSVHLLYLDSLENMDLRELLEKTLTQRCTPQETTQFQDYVRKAKKRLKNDKAAQAKVSGGPPSARFQKPKVNGTQATPNKVSPTSKSAPPTGRATRSKSVSRPPSPPPTQKAVVSKTESVQVEVKNVKDGPTCSVPKRVESHHTTEDSGYGSEQTGEKAESSTKGTTPSENGSAKRKAESVTSSQEAEQEDLEEARSKRRKRAATEESTEYHPSAQKRRAKSTKKSRNETDGRVSRDSSPLSEPPDEDDIEQAKEAYVDEMVRRKSADAARQAIEDKYGPVSPSIIGDTRSEPAESWASMPSPTMEPSRPVAASRQAASSQTDQATAGAQNSQSEPAQAAPTEIPGPPPEGFTPDEGANAYKLITATVAEAIIPYFKHMETKLGKIEDQQKSIAKTASEQTLPSSKELMDAAKALQSGVIQDNNPETAQMISKLLKNAAEASIHAAEAARKAGEVARDVSEVLMKISGNENDNASASKSSQRSKRKS